MKHLVKGLAAALVAIVLFAGCGNSLVSMESREGTTVTVSAAGISAFPKAFARGIYDDLASIADVRLFALRDDSSEIASAAMAMDNGQYKARLSIPFSAYGDITFRVEARDSSSALLYEGETTLTIAGTPQVLTIPVSAPQVPGGLEFSITGLSEPAGDDMFFVVTSPETPIRDLAALFAHQSSDYGIMIAGASITIEQGGSAAGSLFEMTNLGVPSGTPWQPTEGQVYAYYILAGSGGSDIHIYHNPSEGPLGTISNGSPVIRDLSTASSSLIDDLMYESFSISGIPSEYNGADGQLLVFTQGTNLSESLSQASGGAPPGMIAFGISDSGSITGDTYNGILMGLSFGTPWIPTPGTSYDLYFVVADSQVSGTLLLGAGSTTSEPPLVFNPLLTIAAEADWNAINLGAGIVSYTYTVPKAYGVSGIPAAYEGQPASVQVFAGDADLAYILANAPAEGPPEQLIATGTNTAIIVDGAINDILLDPWNAGQPWQPVPASSYTIVVTIGESPNLTVLFGGSTDFSATPPVIEALATISGSANWNAISAVGAVEYQMNPPTP